MGLWKRVFRIGGNKRDQARENSDEDQEETMIFGIRVKPLPREILKDIEVMTRANPWSNTEDITLEICTGVFGIDESKLSGEMRLDYVQRSAQKLRIVNTYLRSLDVDQSSSQSPGKQRHQMFTHLVMREVDRIKGLMSMGE